MNPNLSFDRIVVHERHWPIVIGRTGLQIANQKFTRVSRADNEGPPGGRADNLQPFSKCANGQPDARQKSAREQPGQNDDRTRIILPAQ